MWLFLLLPACAASVLSCLRLVRAVALADALAEHDAPGPGASRGIGLYETAYLAGGPDRVVDLALVLMAARRRLHLAHTGWTTVVDPRGRDRLERTVIDAVGPDGQCRTGELRRTLSRSPAVREIGGRLALAGLATPSSVRRTTAAAVRRIRAALLLTVALLAACLLLRGDGGGAVAPVLAWFSLPVILTCGTLLMARAGAHPYTRWAAPAGQELLRSVRAPCQIRRREALRAVPAPGNDDDLLTAVAMAGPAAVPDPLLRAALRAPHR